MKLTIRFLLACAITTLVIFSQCKKDEVPKNDLKEVVEYALNPTSDFEREFEIEAYYWNEGAPILITDLSLLKINALLPRTAYISLSGPGFKLMDGKPEFIGSLIRIKGKVIHFTDQYKLDHIEFICPELPFIITGRKAEVLLPVPGSFCDYFPALCGPSIIPTPGSFALLYSGGFDAEHAYDRYWNDLRFMYAVLHDKYGFSDENIVVVYKDGQGEDDEMTVDFAASPTGFQAAIDNLRGRMKPSDNLFVFTTNHGGGLHRGGGHQRINDVFPDGLADTDFDENEAENMDEVFYYYNASTPLSDDFFADAINSIPHQQLIALLEPCFSGGFIRDLSGSNAVIMSACMDDEYSSGGLDVNGVPFDVFSYYFTEALNRADPNGHALSTNPDTDGNGVVSMYEAFQYARSRDYADETPLLEADGDGIGRSAPSLNEQDGITANNVSLR